MGKGSGAIIFNKTDLTNTATLVVATAAALAWYHVFNTTTAEAYLQLFDAAAATDVTVGTTAPTLVLGIPAETGAGLGAGACCAIPYPVRFNKGIVVASTTTATGNTGAITAIALGVTV